MEPPGVTKRVRDEVEAPALARPTRDRTRGPGSGGSLAATTASYGQSLFPVRPSQLLLVHGDAF